MPPQTLVYPIFVSASLFGYLQGALLLPALRYAENGTFTINFWQRVHRRFPDASQYMLSHQSLLPANVNASAWGPDQVWTSSNSAATLSAICNYDVNLVTESGVCRVRRPHRSVKYAGALTPL
jgi:hypothetical protein